MDDEEESLQDSIRGSQKSHRRADVGHMLASHIEEIRRVKQTLRASPEVESRESSLVGEDEVVKRANREDSLPLSPAKAARLGLTSILPPMKVKDDEKFMDFLTQIMDPDLRSTYPTYTALAKRFQVSVQTLKTWLLSEELAKVLEASIAHEARLTMPSVLRSVRLRAELTGDPHAAEFIRKVAKLGTAETDASRSFEKTIRQIAADRAGASKPLTTLPEGPVFEENGEPVFDK